MSGERVLQTERLVLRLVDEDDAAFLLELMNEEGWLRFIGDRGIRGLDEARAYARRACMEPQAAHGFSLLRVDLAATGEPVGLCGLVSRPTLPAPDLGFAFLQRFGGRGLAREAAAAMLAHAAGPLALPRVLAITSPENARSIRLLEALGFRALPEAGGDVATFEWIA